MKNEKPSNQSFFGIIPDTVFFDEKLTDRQKLIYILIQKLTNQKGFCFASNKYIAEKMKSSSSFVSKAISKLIKLGYLYSQMIKNEKGEIVQRRLYPNNNPSFNLGEGVWHTRTRGMAQPSYRGMARTCQENNISNYNNISLNNSYSQAGPDRASKDPSKELRKDIISYLNKKTNKNYKPNSNKTKSLINARFNEGFQDLNDYKKVIDVKTDEWQDDPKMEKFLRPETLFGNKFEGYLNQTPKQKGYMDDKVDSYYEKLKAEEERILNGDNAEYFN